MAFPRTPVVVQNTRSPGCIVILINELWNFRVVVNNMVEFRVKGYVLFVHPAPKRGNEQVGDDGVHDGLDDGLWAIALKARPEVAVPKYVQRVHVFMCPC